MCNTRNINNSSKSTLGEDKKIETVKSLLLEMGVVLADTGHVWENNLRTAFNKAVKRLDKKDVSLTS